MPSPNYYDVIVSREAGVFTGHIHVQAEGKADAKKKALKIAKGKWNNEKFWKYTEAIFDMGEKPLIQVEEVLVE